MDSGRTPDGPIWEGTPGTSLGPLRNPSGASRESWRDPSGSLAAPTTPQPMLRQTMCTQLHSQGSHRKPRLLNILGRPSKAPWFVRGGGCWCGTAVSNHMCDVLLGYQGNVNKTYDYQTMSTSPDLLHAKVLKHLHNREQVISIRPARPAICTFDFPDGRLGQRRRRREGGGGRKRKCHLLHQRKAPPISRQLVILVPFQLRPCGGQIITSLASQWPANQPTSPASQPACKPAVRLFLV